MVFKANTIIVSFFFEKKDFTLKNRAVLKSFLASLFKKEKKKLSSLNYVFCSDQRLLEINKQFLKHDYYTDIITFDLSLGPATEAEIYISVDRVRENARLQSVSFTSELHRVIFHGALHLCGYKDKKKTDSLLMRKMEDKYLEAWPHFKAGF